MEKTPEDSPHHSTHTLHQKVALTITLEEIKASRKTITHRQSQASPNRTVFGLSRSTPSHLEEPKTKYSSHSDSDCSCYLSSPNSNLR